MLAGKDGSIAEYELQRLSASRGLCLQSMHHICGPAALSAGATPTALAFAPPLPYFAQGSADTLLLVADDAHKLRVYNADSHTCVCTAVGPLHGGPVNSCRVFRSDAPSPCRLHQVSVATAMIVEHRVHWPVQNDPFKMLYIKIS